MNAKMMAVKNTSVNSSLKYLCYKIMFWNVKLALLVPLLMSFSLQAQQWTPADLSAGVLKNWYDAADTNTLWQDEAGTIPVSINGQTVMRWDDKSGSGNYITGTNGPSYTNAVINSLPVLNFADDSLRNSTPTMGNMTDNFLVIGVFKVTGNNNFDHWIKWGNGNQGGSDLYTMLDGTARANGSVGSMEFHYDGTIGTCTTNPVLGAPAFIFAGEVNQVDNPTNLITVWMNGGFQGSSVPSVFVSPSSSLTYFQIGYANTSNRNPNGQIAELLILNTGTNTLAEADRQKIEGFLANKWWGAGTNNPLPNDHPYKNSPPVTNILPPPVPVLLPGAVRIIDGVPTINFATVAGYRYRVLYKNMLSDSTWQVVAPGFFNSNGADITISDFDIAGQASRFYRVEAANP